MTRILAILLCFLVVGCAEGASRPEEGGSEVREAEVDPVLKLPKLRSPASRSGADSTCRELNANWECVR